MMQAVTNFIQGAIDLAALLGINFISALAGGFGAAASAFRGENRTKKERTVNFIVGFCAALWGPGLMIWGLGLPKEPQTFGILGFLCGYFGMAISDAASQFDWRSILESWLKRR